MELISTTHKFAALFFFAIAFFFFWLSFSPRAASRRSDRKFKLRERGRREAQLIGETIEYVTRLFSGRYMPIALCQLLARARQCQSELLRRSWQIENQAQLNGLIQDAVYMRDRLVAASSAPFSAPEREADRLALIAEAADVEDRAVAERDEADAAHQEELARIACTLAGERARIADAKKLLAAMPG